MIFGRTRAVADKLLRDIRCTVFWVSLVVQIVFMGYYGWSIYSNIQKLPFLITYTALAVVSLTAFITFLITNKHKERKNKRFNRFLRVMKYIINGGMLAVNAYEMLNFTPSDLKIILFGLSALIWLANIVLEIIRAVVEKYCEWFSIAFEEDLAFIGKLKKASEVKGNFFEFIDAPLEAVANLFEKKKEKQATEKEIAAAQVADIAKEFKAEQKAVAKERSEKRAEKEKQEIKEHFKKIKENIFNRKKTK